MAELQNKLDQLDDLLNQYEDDERRPLECYFVGALSVEVSQEIWTNCLKSAESRAYKYGNKRKSTVEVSNG